MTTALPQLTPQQLQELIQGPSDVEWKYDMRHKCQEILPGLFLGPFVISKQLDSLQKLGITHIVCIRDAKEAFSVKPRFPQSFAYLTLDVADSDEQNLIRLFPGAQRFINEAIAGGGRVLVHCNGGISLSPAFVIMFVMQHHQLGWEDALHFVQNRRYCISPNGGFLTQLKEYESIYRATIAVQSYPRAQGQRVVSRRKREDDEDEDDAIREDKRMLVADADGSAERQTVKLKRSFQNTPEPADTDAAMKTEDDDAMMMDS